MSSLSASSSSSSTPSSQGGQAMMNQGFLWHVTDPATPDASLHLLCMEGHQWENPFHNNPKISEVFEQVKVLYFEYPMPSESRTSYFIDRITELFKSEEIPPELLIEAYGASSDYVSKAKLSPLAKKLLTFFESKKEGINL